MNEHGNESTVQARAAMIDEQLVRRGVRDPNVLAAMGRIPRERFVSGSDLTRAYDDAALASDCGQTISQPFMVARMTELLRLDPEDRVLEIGTGTGYQTAVLAAIASHVYSIEWHLPLLNRASERLANLGFRNVTLRCGDGSVGWPAHAPYDAILVTAGAPSVPPALTEQLSEGGVLVAPVGTLDEFTLMRVTRRADCLEQEEVLACRFVPLLGAAGWREAPDKIK